MNLRDKPALLHPPFPKRPDGQVYTGEIRVSQVFAWEPHLSYARELVIVTRIECGQIWCKNIDDTNTVTWGPANDEARFREAVYGTQLNDMWTATPDHDYPYRYFPPSIAGPLLESIERARRAEHERRVALGLVESTEPPIIVKVGVRPGP